MMSNRQPADIEKGRVFWSALALLFVSAVFAQAYTVGNVTENLIITAGEEVEFVSTSTVGGNVLAAGPADPTTDPNTTIDIYGGVVNGTLYGILVGANVDVTIHGTDFALGVPISGTPTIVESGGMPVAIDVELGWKGEVSWKDSNGIEWTMLFSSNYNISLASIGGGATAPEIESVVADTSDPVVEGSAVTVTVTFAGSPSDATITWGDGSSETVGDVEAPSFDATHVYSTAGVYTVGVTLTNDGGTDSATYEYVVVYDPTSGALVTGLGWIPNESVAFGRTYFGFLCTQWGGGTPCGWVRVRWGDKRFCATELDWVGADDLGETAWFGGVGRVNGAGEYFFIVELTDNPDSIWITIFYDEEYDSGGFVGLGDGVTRIRMYDWN